jgi:hypothetical protein
MKTFIKIRLREEVLKTTNEDWKSNLKAGVIGGAMALSSLASSPAKAQNIQQKNSTQVTQNVSSSDFDKTTLDSLSSILNTNVNIIDFNDFDKLNSKDGKFELDGGKKQKIKDYYVDIQNIDIVKKNNSIVDVTLLVMTVSNESETIDIDYVKSTGKFNVVSVSPVDIDYKDKGFTKISLDKYTNDNNMAGYTINNKFISDRKELAKHFISIKKLQSNDFKKLIQHLGTSYKNLK